MYVAVLDEPDVRPRLGAKDQQAEPWGALSEGRVVLQGTVDLAQARSALLVRTHASRNRRAGKGGGGMGLAPGRGRADRAAGVPRRRSGTGHPLNIPRGAGH